ncbi:MAG: GNAT family N-acetyltransferase [Ignavibacteriaceae bacterium]
MDKNPAITTRKFNIDDYDALIELWKEAQLPYKPKGRDSKKKIESELKKEVAIFLVAETDNKIIGSVFGTHDGRKGWINRVAVHPQYRQKGLAKMLVSEVEKKLDELGIDIVACLIEDWNDRSMKVFEKLGYIKHNDVIYFSKRKNVDT